MKITQTKTLRKRKKILRCYSKDNPKKLRGFISVVVPLKKLTKLSDFFLKKYCFEKMAKVFIILMIMIT